MRRSMFFCTAWVLLLLGCASGPTGPGGTQASSQIPDYITAPRGCAILVGGSVGSSFEDPKISGFWNTVNEQISGYLFDNLKNDKYQVVKLIVAPTDKLEQVTTQAMARNRCSRLIQLTHIVNEDAKGKFFQFNVELMHVKPVGARVQGATETRVVTVREFLREYRYPRTPAVMQSFRTGTFADSAYRELAASGALAPLRP